MNDPPAAPDPGRKAYLERCRRILADAREANDEARAHTGVISCMLRVTALVTFAALHLGPILAAFLKKPPGVALQVQLDGRYSDLRSDSVDVALRIGKLTRSSLVARRLSSCRMVRCASPASVASHGPITTPDELASLPLLSFSGAVSVADWTVRDTGGGPRRIDGFSRLSADNMQMLAAAAMSDAGVVFGPTLAPGSYWRASPLPSRSRLSSGRSWSKQDWSASENYWKST